MTPAPPAHDELMTWAAKGKLLGISDEVVFSRLAEVGLSEETARAQLAALVASPLYQAANSIAVRLRKQEQLLEARNRLRALSQDSATIPEVSGISPPEFLERYYSRNEPVKLLGMMQAWSAPSLWSPGYLKERVGDELIEFMAVPEGASADVSHVRRTPQIGKFSQYIDLIEGCGSTNKYYLVGYNRFMEKPGAAALFEDIILFPGFLNPSSRKGRVFFWYGPQGTVTPLHHDTSNIFMAQVRGKKHIKLVSPEDTPYIYNSAAVFSEVDCESPDYDRHPAFKKAKVYDVVLEPGQVLFLPVGWWHHVRALDVSITVTFTNFVFPNEFAFDPLPTVDFGRKISD